MREQPDMTWALPIFIIFAIGMLYLLIEVSILEHCVRKRFLGQRAANWLEFLAGYDKEQRKR